MPEVTIFASLDTFIALRSVYLGLIQVVSHFNNSTFMSGEENLDREDEEIEKDATTEFNFT